MTTWEDKVSALTNLASGGVHLGTANGREAAEEDVQFVGGHVPREVTAKYLGDHAEEHHISGTETVERKFSTKTETVFPNLFVL